MLVQYYFLQQVCVIQRADRIQGCTHSIISHGAYRTCAHRVISNGRLSALTYCLNSKLHCFLNMEAYSCSRIQKRTQSLHRVFLEKVINSSSATPGIPCTLWNAMDHYHVHNSAPFVPVLSQINLTFIICSHLRSGFPSGIFLSGFPT